MPQLGGAGDTLQPCQELLELGMGATVLIHEASFAQDKAREARRKFHSTSEDAIEAGAERTAHAHTLTRHARTSTRLRARPHTTRHSQG